MDTSEEFGKELDALLLDSEPQQTSASAAAQPVNEPDPVLQADAWRQYHQQHRLAKQQAQNREHAGGSASGGYPQRPQQNTSSRQWQQPAYYGEAPAGQQGYLGPVGHMASSGA